MDNQGSNNFNNGQGVTPQDTNFWNPISSQGQPETMQTPASQPTQSSPASGFTSVPATSTIPGTPATSAPAFNPQSLNQSASAYSSVNTTASPQTIFCSSKQRFFYVSGH